MRLFTFVSVLSCMAVLAACSQVISPFGKTVPDVPGFDVLSLERHNCFFGTCPVYTLQISADGDVHFIAKDPVTVTGRRDGRLSPHDLARLSAALRRVDFDKLRKRYVSEGDGCVNVMTDQPSLDITVKRGDTSKTVMLYMGCQGPDVPSEELTRLAQTMDAITGTRSRAVP